jgi:hypothetical protein
MLFSHNKLSSRGGVRWSMKSQGHTFTVLARIGMQVNWTHLRSTRSLRTESRRAKPHMRRGVIPAMPCRRCEVHCWKGVWPWSDPTSKQWLQIWRLYKHWLLGRVGDRSPTLLTAVKGIPRRRLLSPSLIFFFWIFFEYFFFDYFFWLFFLIIFFLSIFYRVLSSWGAQHPYLSYCDLKQLIW